MWLLLILSIVLLVIELIITGSNWDEDAIWASWRASFFLWIGIVLALVTWKPFDYKTIIQTNQVNLIAIKDSTQINGSFFLGSGTINQQAVYYYYTEDSGNNITLHHITAESAIVKEDSPQGTGYIETFVEVNDPKWEDKTRGWLLWTHIVNNQYSPVIHVPEGSVTRKFDVGLP